MPSINSRGQGAVNALFQATGGGGPRRMEATGHNGRQVRVEAFDAD